MKEYSTYPVIDILKAAFCAYRTNGNTIVRESMFDLEAVGEEKVLTKIPNVELINQHLENKSLLKISDEDCDYASMAIQSIDHERTLKLLRGENTTEFVDGIIKEGKEEQSNKIKLLLWVPEIFFRIIEKEQFEEAILQSDYVGKIGDKMTINVEVIRKKYLPKLSCWIVTTKNKENNVIQWFTAKDECTVSGKYFGIVSKLEENPYLRGAKITMLNRVKVLDK
jgi:hypothetical protein